MINLIGKTLGKYKILEEIGRGGMAIVYKAVDTTTRQTVALKVLPPYFQHDPALLRRFQREAEAAARLCHRHIVQIYEAGQAQGVSYIAMEYVPHRSLQAQLQAGQPLDFTLALTIMSQIASALDYAAQRGVIHRDVKPSNILLGQDAQGQLRAMLADFGIARAMEHSLLTRSGSVLGTPEYMSPEQAEGERLDHRSDLYSLGVVLYQMLTGRVPFSGESAPAILHAQVYDLPTRPSALNRRLGTAAEAVLLKGLAKRPEDRFQSGAEMVTALRRAMASPQAEPATVMEVPTREAHGRRITPRPISKGKSTPWLLLGGLMVGVLAVWAVLMALFMGWPPVPPPTAIVVASPSPPPTWPATWTPTVTNTPTVTPMPTVSNTPVTSTPTPPMTNTPILPPAPVPTGGGRIAFESYRDGNREIYVMNADGSGLMNLTNHPAMDLDPSWSPDGMHIAFSSDRNGNGEIYVMNADGSGLTNLTNHPADDANPSWSPDGTRIAFKSGRAGGYEIYVMNADGSDQMNLTNHPDWDMNPSWSPDGRRIAFDSSRGGSGWEIYVMNADGSGQTKPTNNPLYGRTPSWSPDGRRITFACAGICVINTDGSGLANLTYSPGWYNYESPSWSPDGTRIAFSANGGIYVMNADGGRLTNLTNYPDAGDQDPSWSPK